MKSAQLGPELEFLLIDQEGKVVPKGPEILAQTTNKNLFPEFLNEWVEVGAQQSHSIYDVAQNFKSNIEELIRICEKEGIFPIPLSTNITRDYQYQFSAKKEPLASIARNEVFYSDVNFSGKDILGLHCHLDVHPKHAIRLRQRHALTALDILTVLTASSPFLDGKVAGNDPRLGVQRHSSHALLTPLKGLQPYLPTMDDYKEATDMLYEEMKKELVSRGYDASFAGENPNKNVFGPVRRCLEGKKNTLEHRAPSAGLFSNSLAYLTAVKATNTIVTETPLQYSSDPQKIYSLTPQGFVLPEFPLLKHLEEAKQKGLQETIVHTALNNLYHAINSFVDPEEAHFLGPYATILETRRNTSDAVLWEAQKARALSDATIREGATGDIRLAYNHMFVKDLNTLNAHIPTHDYRCA